MEIAFLILAGILGGILAGMIGIGGGIVYVLILGPVFAALGVTIEDIPSLVVANSIFCVVFAAGAAVLTLAKQKEFFVRPVLYLGLPAALVAVIVSKFVVNNGRLSPVLFDTLLIALLLWMLLKIFANISRSTNLVAHDHHSPLKFGVTGFFGGLVASLSGLGGGVVMVPLMNVVLRLDIKVARSISLGAIFIASFSMSVGNIMTNDFSPDFLGLIHLETVLPLIVGVTAGGFVGVKISRILSSRSITFVYAAFLCLFLIKKANDLFLLIFDAS